MTEAEKKQPIDIANLVIDVGTTSAEETKEVLKIDTGCPIAPDTEWEYFKTQDVMMGKAFDNRIGTACLMAAMSDLAEANLDVNLVGGIASQEEVGCRGAKVTIKKYIQILRYVLKAARLMIPLHLNGSFKQD